MSHVTETSRGTLFVVAAPSGAGKSTLVNALLAREPGISLSISHTTRAPRPNESEGNHYHFVSRDVFQRMIDADQFFEYAVVHGDMKGTSLTAVAPLLEEGRDVLLEIDWQGARQVRKKVPDCQSIFILPPSRAELERRLRARASDSAEAIERRLRDSRTEIAHAEEFDFIVVNDDFDTALDDMQAIVRAVRLRTPLQRVRHETLIAELLGQGDVVPETKP
ncbi:MAG TPA: guanylate kinase [Rhodanobacteraceae bacterium]|nr:guanylate kinase [Rhodanobacteraceae bacterium]